MSGVRGSFVPLASICLALWCGCLAEDVSDTLGGSTPYGANFHQHQQREAVDQRASSRPGGARVSDDFRLRYYPHQQSNPLSDRPAESREAGHHRHPEALVVVGTTTAAIATNIQERAAWRHSPRHEGLGLYDEKMSRNSGDAAAESDGKGHSREDPPQALHRQDGNEDRRPRQLEAWTSPTSLLKQWTNQEPVHEHLFHPQLGRLDLVNPFGDANRRPTSVWSPWLKQESPFLPKSVMLPPPSFLSGEEGAPTIEPAVHFEHPSPEAEEKQAQASPPGHYPSQEAQEDEHDMMVVSSNQQSTPAHIVDAASDRLPGASHNQDIQQESRPQALLAEGSREGVNVEVLGDQRSQIKEEPGQSADAETPQPSCPAIFKGSNCDQPAGPLPPCLPYGPFKDKWFSVSKATWDPFLKTVFGKSLSADKDKVQSADCYCCGQETNPLRAAHHARCCFGTLGREECRSGKSEISSGKSEISRVSGQQLPMPQSYHPGLASLVVFGAR